MIHIQSNGSHFAGSGPSTLEELYEALQNYALDRTFEMYGNFIMKDPGSPTRFFGNFFNLSHVFNIDTDEPEIINRLTLLIRENQRRADYLSQPDPIETQRIESLRTWAWSVARSKRLDSLGVGHVRTIRTASGSKALYNMTAEQLAEFLREQGIEDGA